MMILGWIVRILAILLLIRIALRFLSGLGQAARGAGSGRPSSRTPQTREGGRLVRDPQCGTHIPLAGATALTTGEATHYFCSTRCRDEWTAARRVS